MYLHWYILSLFCGIAFPAKTVAAIDSEPIFAMDFFSKIMRIGSEVKKLWWFQVENFLNRWIGLKICIENPIENKPSWFWNTSFSIGFSIQIVRPIHRIRKFSTWNHHNFLTSEPFLIKLKNKSIANIGSESIAATVLAGNAMPRSKLKMYQFGVLWCP